jgi:cell division control protein 12
MHDLITSTNEKHYEEYRAKKLVQAGVTDEFIGVPNLKKEEEELRKRFTEQVKLEEQRFRKWEQNLISERDRLNKDLESFHEEVKELEAEIESLSQ